eukprot:1877916-Prorocentrum_lima.AAC.1
MTLGKGSQEGIITALKEKCQGDIHTRGCEKCRKALGHMRNHHHGKSTSTNVLSADLSGPHSKAI